MLVVSENNMAASITQKSKYVGETKKLLRNGYGVYTYENQFFKYQGEWSNGKKHGHGKLVMKDGTFYEGQFINGEIQGHGYKYFAVSGNKYTGNFERGELHGYGIMQYIDGTMFEGEWAHNKKQGYGVLKTSEVGTYHGEFTGSLKHGQGTMLYDNGDRYDGHWVMDKRQGQGHLKCRDGTIYDGQWLNDMFHGDGKMNHASGIIYDGLWINGYPANMATKLNIVLESENLELQQGATFSVRVECLNNDDELIEDQGRELQVSAGFKHYPTKEGSALFDMIEDVEEKPIDTPFGYSIVTYPLTDQLTTEEEEKEVEGKKEEEIKKEEETETETKTTHEELTVKTEDGTEEEKCENGGEKLEEKKIEGEEKEGLKDVPNEGEIEETAQVSTQQEHEHAVPESSTTTTAPAVESTPIPPPLANQRVVGGVCEWACLQLAPPPPMYRPFLAMEEEAGLKKTKSKKQVASKQADKSGKKDVKEKSSAENLVDEQFARPGEYVIMVQDVTSPPFFSGPLPPSFVIVKVLKPKPKKKEPKAK